MSYICGILRNAGKGRLIRTWPGWNERAKRLPTRRAGAREKLASCWQSRRIRRWDSRRRSGPIRRFHPHQPARNAGSLFLSGRASGDRAPVHRRLSGSGDLCGQVEPRGNRGREPRAAGVRGFDVASPFEIRLIKRLCPEAAMHYNNPVRSRSEIAVAVESGVVSYSVDSASELAKLIELVPAEGTEITVRFKLPVSGATTTLAPSSARRWSLRPNCCARWPMRASSRRSPSTRARNAPIRRRGSITSAPPVRSRMARREDRRLNVGGGFPSHRISAEAPRSRRSLP